MGETVNSFAEGTPASMAFFPVLVTGWDTLRPVLARWGLEVPEVLGSKTTLAAVKVIRGDAIARRLADAIARASLTDITEAEAVDYLAMSWESLARYSARYERRRIRKQPTGLAWLMARKALGEYRDCARVCVPLLNREA